MGTPLSLRLVSRSLLFGVFADVAFIKRELILFRRMYCWRPPMRYYIISTVRMISVRKHRHSKNNFSKKHRHSRNDFSKKHRHGSKNDSSNKKSAQVRTCMSSVVNSDTKKLRRAESNLAPRWSALLPLWAAGFPVTGLEEGAMLSSSILTNAGLYASLWWGRRRRWW
jgi:hypothetical protein